MRSFRPLVNVVVALALAACGPATEEGTDGGDGQGTPDAGGQQGTPDGGGNGAAPNAGANGSWALVGPEGAACGMNLRGTWTGAAIAAPATRGFTLTSPNKFNGFDVILTCELAEGAKTFTCSEYVKSVPISGCNFSGGLRSITGSLDGTSGTLAGQAYTTGSGNCAPTAQCGPNSISVSGPITAPSP